MAPFCPFFHNCNITSFYLLSATSLICLIYFSLALNIVLMEINEQFFQEFLHAVMNICRFAHDLKIKIFLSCSCFSLLSFLSAGGMLWTKHLLCLPEGHALYGIQASRGFSLGYKWGRHFFPFLKGWISEQVIFCKLLFPHKMINAILEVFK